MALYITRYAVDLQSRSGQTPRLPPEICDMIVEAAIARAKATGEGDSLCKLMHVNSSVRYQVARSFKTLDFFEIYVESELDAALVPVYWDLLSYIFQALNYHCRDFSVKRHGKPEPVIPKSTVRLVSTSGLVYNRLTCLINVFTARGSTSDFFEEADSEAGLHVNDLAARRNHLLVLDACTILREALSQDGLQDIPSAASVFRRARSGQCSADEPVPALRFDIDFIFENVDTDGSDTLVTRSWRFVTVPPQTATSLG